jgi:ComF family protein
MRFLLNLVDSFLEFFFPKSPSVIKLESLSTSELLKTLTPGKIETVHNTLALFDYKDPIVREMIWELKYGGNRTVAEKLGSVLYDVLLDELKEKEMFENWKSPLLVPIPISDSRRYERGWNQSELLAKAIKKEDKQGYFKYMPGQLVRYRHTESQTKTASRNERLQNIRNSMRVLNPHLFKGGCVILIYDVITTGATFSEAKRVLKECGVRKIICVAVAH